MKWKKERKKDDRWAKESNSSCEGVGRHFESLSRGEQSITAVSMTGNAYDRAGVGIGNRTPLEEPTKTPAMGELHSAFVSGDT